MGAGKFLGYLITNRGIEVNPDQIDAVKRLKPLSNQNEVQVLTGMLVALNRFISKFVDPLQSLLKRSNFTGRIAKWGTQLGSFDIRYRPRSLVKGGQVLADFVAEFSLREGKEIVCPVEVIPWKVFVDGASSALGTEAGIVVITPSG